MTIICCVQLALHPVTLTVHSVVHSLYCVNMLLHYVYVALYTVKKYVYTVHSGHSVILTLLRANCSFRSVKTSLLLRDNKFTV